MSDLERNLLALAKEHALSHALIPGGGVVLTGTWYALAWFQTAILNQFAIETPIVYTRRAGKVVDGPRIEISAKVLT